MSLYEWPIKNATTESWTRYFARVSRSFAKRHLNWLSLLSFLALLWLIVVGGGMWATGQL